MTLCAVPGCTHVGPSAGHICPNHMRGVDKRLRRRLAAERDRISSDPSLFRYRVLLKLWRKAREQAIERAVGL